MEKPSKAHHFRNWFYWWFCFGMAGTLMIFACGFARIPDDFENAYLETFTDPSCLTTLASKIKPPDNSVCSSVDPEVLSYKFSDVDSKCQIWLYGNDTTCSDVTPVPFLQFQSCISASKNRNFLIQCPYSVQPYKDPTLPKPSITTTVGFKVGLAFGVWLILYISFSIWCACRHWKKACKKYREFQGKQSDHSADVEMQPEQNTSISQENGELAFEWETNATQNEESNSAAESTVPALVIGKTYVTERPSQVTSLPSDPDQISIQESHPPPYEERPEETTRQN